MKMAQSNFFIVGLRKKEMNYHGSSFIHLTKDHEGVDCDPKYQPRKKDKNQKPFEYFEKEIREYPRQMRGPFPMNVMEIKSIQ